MRNPLIALLGLSLLLSGCAAPVVVGLGAAAAGAVVATDRRTTGTMMDDERIELKTMSIVANDPIMRENSHVNATSFNGQLLLTGEVPDIRSREKLESEAAKLQRVRVIKNELAVAPVSSSGERATDTRITSRVKARMVSELGAKLASNVKVVTEAGTVYLMGLVSHDEATRAVEVARYTIGVQRIVKVFEYL